MRPALTVFVLLSLLLCGCPPSQPSHHARLVLSPPDAPQRHMAALP